MDLTDSTDDDGSRRTRFIATMHALIAWLVAHPDVPCPWSVGLSIDVPDVETLQRLAAQLDTPAWPHTGTPQQINATLTPASGEFYTPISITVRQPDAADRPL
jgi:hypothetical protein